MSNVIEQHTNKKNLLQLVYLRAIAIVGQLATILIVHYGMEITLPLTKMLGVIGFLVALNIISWHRYKTQKHISGTELYIELLLDTAALTAQLYLSGGASNPFVSLFLLQVIIGAVLLRPMFAWGLLAATSACYLMLTFHSQDLQHMYHYHLGEFFNLHIHGMLISYVLAASLLVLFLTKINANLKERDTRLATLKQQSVEEEHIMRMSLLAAGAAHELGTPLTTISIILKDLQSLPMPDSKTALNEDIETMQRELERCKTIVSGILLSSGQVRGEDAEITKLQSFMDAAIAEWKTSRQPAMLEYRYGAGDIAIISDTVIRQMLFNLFDNALDASPEWVEIDVSCTQEAILIRVMDHGKGFSPEALESFGKPYTSSKSGHGRGLGLFLVVNTLRKLGGQVIAENTATGAMVTLTIPLAAIEAREHD